MFIFNIIEFIIKIYIKNLSKDMLASIIQCLVFLLYLFVYCVYKIGITLLIL